MNATPDTSALTLPAQRPRATPPRPAPHEPSGPLPPSGAGDRSGPGEPAGRTASTEARGAVPDPRLQVGRRDWLAHPDPHTAADAATVENLLRCWIRETHPVQPGDGVLRVPLPTSGTALHARIRYWSPTGHHRFSRVLLDGGAPADAVTVAALLTREALAGSGAAPAARRHRLDLVARVADSVRLTARFLEERRAEPAAAARTPFLDAEQALVLGHPLHPTPKSRDALDDTGVRAYSPELRGCFPLHWFAVDRSVLAADSAWTRRGRVVPAEHLAAELAGPSLPLPPGTVPLPVHPWQAAHLTRQPRVRALVERGLLHDLGPAGDPWYPTSSLRTVHRPASEVMPKLSLALRITNSRRENLPKELCRGLEVHRLLRTGLARQWHAAHPGFDVVRDPAWLTVADPEPDPGFAVVLRNNPFRPGEDVVCVAGLTAPRPWPGRPATELRSRLAVLVSRLAARTRRPAPAVATEWFLRYLDRVVLPVLWLDGEAGVALEAHQQNTLVRLDRDGWPVGGAYRDNQGYYYRESRREDLQTRLPGIGTASDTFVADAVADERFAYYLGINNVLGLIGSFGAQRLADERVLLAAFRRFLTGAAAGRSTFPARLLDSPTLRCKANLLTRLHGLDELVGPVDGQSVYVTVPNPLARGAE
ncbi:iron transporter [Wenjunlia vitaminophila]|uniref:Iron transporter n=1 Tax=Wenjunlia vitaminophila TaxID=76728 RepID=A0A0T6LZ47_WENVI|nr:IucA/IucC family protein [Wenjunlia vitaminophila]KRV51463.1 iron transporter [Wenjunlia vitaminophila]